jgi:PilZ domain
MPERTRAILARLRKFIGDRRRAERRQIRLSFTITLPGARTGKGSQSIEGHTLDVSTSGLALIVPVIRVGEHYLAGEDHALQIMLELPTGKVELSARPVRYERLDEDESETGYLIGVNIAEMNDADRARYEEYVATLLVKSMAAK